MKINKKGFGMGEVLMLVIVLFLFAILAVLGDQVFTDLNDDLQADPDISPTVKAQVDNLAVKYPTLFDASFITILALLFILGIVASLIVNSHPVMIIIVIVLMGFIGLAAGFISNAWEEFAADDEISTFADDLPMTSWVLENFLLIITIAVLTFGGIIYAKRSNA